MGTGRQRSLGPLQKGLLKGLKGCSPTARIKGTTGLFACVLTFHELRWNDNGIGQAAQQLQAWSGHRPVSLPLPPVPSLPLGLQEGTEDPGPFCLPCYLPPTCRGSHNGILMQFPPPLLYLHNNKSNK